jgi:LmbE family N-acetylglucosaminyl deacetylase
MKKKMLGVFAHPDDEAFGPGGMFAKYGQDPDVEIHLLTATRGEAGLWNEVSKTKAKTQDQKIHHVREEELKKSAKILGIEKLEFLDYIDGTLSNSIYHELAAKITKKIDEWKPDVVMTNERRGVSGHLDHIAISMITTFAFKKSKYGKKLYYHCISEKMRSPQLDDYFVYFPEGYKEEEITTRIEYSKFWDVRVKAMRQHESQTHDVERILEWAQDKPKIDTFILADSRGVKYKLPETDLFAGIS